MMRSQESPKHRTVPRAALALALLGILILGSAFRFYNVNWDEGTYHIHPDERHTTMVVTRIQWPASLAEYFDTSRSPLNARNVDTVYFYGTLPLFLTKAVAGQLDALAPRVPFLEADQSFGSYDRVHLVGRVLSALFDLGSVLLTFFLGRRLFGWRVGLAAAFLLSVTVLNIQGSHYFAVDTFLTFFVILTIWFTLDVAEGRGWPSFLGLGLSMGLTLACKVSVFLLVVVVALGAWVRIRRRLLALPARPSVAAGGEGVGALLGTTLGLTLAVFVALAVFRVAQPYAWAGPNFDAWEGISEGLAGPFEVFRAMPEPLRAVVMPNPQWLDDIASAGAQQTGEADLPWGRQWTERAPWLWPLENMVL
ncbi:MAG TPA: glycosyltransferase family 39 protein, partial [Anaerolineae bacterium]|nr:glycosyltransferase family 39 protein [Anaerolineae bacterium]